MRRNDFLPPSCCTAELRAASRLTTAPASALLFAALLSGLILSGAAASGDDLSLRASAADSASDHDFVAAESPDSPNANADDDTLEAADAALTELTPKELAELYEAEEASAFDDSTAARATSTTVSIPAEFAAVDLAAADELWFISIRRARLPSEGPAGIDVWRYDGAGAWQVSNVRELVAADTKLTTCFHVHGNRVAFCDAHVGGWHYYTTFTAAGCRERGPIRWVVVTWPSDRIDGSSRRDVQVKAVRAECYAYYLAWIVDQLPSEARVSMIGYSFGSRLIGSTLHLLGGGSMRGRTLPDRHDDDREVRAVLLAAAMDNDGFLPGRCMQMAPSQLDRLLVTCNHCDPAMKWYPLLYKVTLRPRTGRQSLGYTGLAGMRCLPELSGRVEHRDMSCVVGREHDKHGCRYLTPWFVEQMRGYVYYDELDAAAE